MSSHVFHGFDIETKPLPELVERFSKPFPDFDESAVKYGNTKDPAKRAELLASKRTDHEADRAAYWKNLKDRAALNPFTAQIVVIGIVDHEGAVDYLMGAEKDLLAEFWALFSEYGEAARKFVFWSGCGAAAKMFDLDFIVTRSRILGVRIPPAVRSGRFYSPRFVDLASEFLLYQNDVYLSLTRAADIFGLYVDGKHPGPSTVGAHQTIFPKTDDDPVTGENFWQWFEGIAQTDQSKEEQRLFALRYLRNDLLHLFHLAPRIL